MNTTKLITVTYADNRSGFEVWADSTWWHGAIVVIGGLGGFILAILFLMNLAWFIKDIKWRKGARQSWAISRVSSGMRYGKYDDKWLNQFNRGDARKQCRMYEDRFAQETGGTQ